MPNGIIHRKLSKLAFELKGDAWEPFLLLDKKLLLFILLISLISPLLFYGENGELEYGGTEKFKNMPKRALMNGKSIILGAGVDELIKEGVLRKVFNDKEINSEAMDLYRPISPSIIKKKNRNALVFILSKMDTPRKFLLL